MMSYLNKITNKFNNKSFNDVIAMVGTQILINPIQMIKSFIVVKYINPEIYGILKSAELIKMLNKFGSLGFKPTIIRNALTAKSIGDDVEVIKIKNNGYSGELLLSFLLFIVGILSSLFFKDNTISIIIILSSIGLFTAKLFGIIQTELQLNKSFSKLSQLILFQGFFNSIFVICLVPFINIYAVLIVPIVSSLIIIIYAYNMIGRFFSFKINWIDLKEILKVGFPLTFGTLAFGFFRYTERILIVSYLGLVATGLFGFADMVISIFITIFLGSVLKVRGLEIYNLLAKSNYVEAHKIVIKETSILILISFGFIALLPFILNFIVLNFLPKWEDAINITILFSFIIPIKLISSYIAFVIKSPTINKLNFEPIIQLTGGILLIVSCLILNMYNLLNLKNFIIVDIAAYGFVHFSYLIYYYKTFYFRFIRN
ncbi:MAG: hypothetical protein CMG25_04965 [Candidatus Marinimicrobia bacterium]|nr:hypothetical protein [Candidatus Neomarinimicrobiota bacterium]